MGNRVEEFKKFVRKLHPQINYWLIPLQKHKKNPITKGKIKENIEQVSVTPNTAIEKIEKGYNIGCYALSDGLVFIDLDLDECDLPQDKIDELLALNTFTVRTRNGGLQLYGINEGFSNSNIYYNNKRLGEIRADWHYVVCVGSYVPPDTQQGDGNYTVVSDNPIKQISPQDLPDWCKITKEKSENKREVNVTPAPKPQNGWTSERNCSLDWLIERDSTLKELLSGPFEAGYPSRSEADFAAAVKLCYYGFTEDDIASILQHYRPYKKTERSNYLSHTISKAVGVSDSCNTNKSESIQDTNLEIIKNHAEISNNYPCSIFTGLPRAKPYGKTFSAVHELAKAESGIYVASKHEIVEHALKIFEQIKQADICVWLEGKARACKTGLMNCETCAMKPDNYREDNINYYDLEEIVEGLKSKYNKITKDIIKDAETQELIELYGGLCPYYCLKIAAKKSRFVFTVPQLLQEIDEWKELGVIDEETTLQYFYPGSVAITEYVVGKKTRSVSNKIPEFNNLRNLTNIPHIVDIREGLRVLDEISEALNEFKDSLITEEQLFEKLESIEQINFRDPDSALDKVKSMMTSKGHPDDSWTFFEPIFFPAKKRFHVETGLGNVKKLHLIADEERIVRDPPLCENHIIIGGRKAELFADQLYNNDEVAMVNFTEVDYFKNFVIIPVELYEKYRDNNGKLQERLSRDKTRKALRKLMGKLYREDIPSLVVTGSKQAQDALVERLSKNNIATESSKQHKRDEQFVNLNTGRPNIIYANSNVSRGIDLDFYDVEILYHCDFTTPYWSAMAEYWNEQPDEEKEKPENQRYGLSPDKFYRIMRQNILDDELTNIAFRIAPVKDWRQIKFLFVPSWYLPRIYNRINYVNADLTQMEMATIDEPTTDVNDLKQWVEENVTALSPAYINHPWDSLPPEAFFATPRIKSETKTYTNPLSKATIQLIEQGVLAQHFSERHKTNSYKTKAEDNSNAKYVTAVLSVINDNSKGITTSALKRKVRKEYGSVGNVKIRQAIKELEADDKIYSKKIGKYVMWFSVN